MRKKPAHHIELAMNTKTNRAEVTVDRRDRGFPAERDSKRSMPARAIRGFLNPEDFITGTSVSIELEGRYQKGRGSVDEFLELTAIANPHARITFVPPSRVARMMQEDLPLSTRKGCAPRCDASATLRGMPRSRHRARRHRSDAHDDRKRRRDLFPARHRSASAGNAAKSSRIPRGSSWAF